VDLTPLITSLLPVCTRETCPEMRAGEWQYICVAHEGKAGEVSFDPESGVKSAAKWGRAVTGMLRYRLYFAYVSVLWAIG
jgi:hypothetical protein